jgi:hypothetical protein
MSAPIAKDPAFQRTTQASPRRATWAPWLLNDEAGTGPGQRVGGSLLLDPPPWQRARTSRSTSDSALDNASPSGTSPMMANDRDRRSRCTRRVAGVTASGFLIVAAFQVALALGAPFGRAALGGANAGRLPPELRLVTTVVAAFWVLAAVHALSRGGFTKSFPRLRNRRFTWALVGVTALGALMNAASSSPWERYGWAPYTLFLMVVCLILALSGRRAVPGQCTCEVMTLKQGCLFRTAPCIRPRTALPRHGADRHDEG